MNGKQKNNVNSLQKNILKSSTGTLGLKISLVALSFLSSIILTRILGVKNFGIYTYCVAWVSLLQVPSEFGGRQFIPREIIKYQSESSWEFLQGLLHWYNRTVFLLSIGIACCAAFIVWLLQGNTSDPTLITFYIALVALPFLALIAVNQGALRGFHATVLSQLPEKLVQPLLLILLTGLAYWGWGENLKVTWVMALKTCSIILAYVAGIQLLLANKERKKIPKDTQRKFETRTWVLSVLPFILITMTNAISIRTDIIMLGILDDVEAPGIYRVVSRGSELISFVLMSLNIALEPVIAKLHTAGRLEELQQTVTKNTRIVFFSSLAIASVLVLFNKFYLSIFGQGFLQGSNALIILCAGQMVKAFAGSAGSLLAMTGYARDSAIGIGASAILNIILNSVLIPRYSINGAASSTAISMMISNIILIVCVYKRLRINPTIVGKQL